VLELLEHRLHPWSAFLIVPLFALANAGVALGGGALVSAMVDPLTWAVAGGLVVGKITGISLATWACVRSGLGRLPAGITRGHVLGVSAVAGIGFTVSLFIAELAYADPVLTQAAKVGIFMGSLVAAMAGAGVFLTVTRRDRAVVSAP
jgi:NhaA family Na+:H+ antiporter